MPFLRFRPILANRAETFMGTQDTIIYRLVKRNHDFDALLKEILFLAGNGRGRHAGAKRHGASRPDEKVCLLGGPFGSTIISKKSKNLGDSVNRNRSRSIKNCCI